jgi:hypothetical protein
MFSPEERAGFIGASDVNVFMGNASEETLLRWWEVKVGIRDPEPQTWAMRLGAAVGDLILDEFERQNSVAITRRQEVVPSPGNKRFRATLDGWMGDRNAVAEAKFSSPFLSREQIYAMYYPQVAFQMHCTDASVGFLIVCQGTNDPIEFECPRDPDYEREVLARCGSMLELIDTLTPPVVMPAPVPPEKWRTVDLAFEQPNWGPEVMAALVEYDETDAAAKAHEAWGKLVRERIPDDVGKVHTGSFTISRNKRGTLAITRKAAA